MNRFKDYITRNLYCAGISQEEYNLIQKDIHEENRKSSMPLHFPEAASGHRYSNHRKSSGCCVHRIR